MRYAWPKTRGACSNVSSTSTASPRARAASATASAAELMPSADGRMYDDEVERHAAWQKAGASAAPRAIPRAWRCLSREPYATRLRRGVRRKGTRYPRLVATTRIARANGAGKTPRLASTSKPARSSFARTDGQSIVR